MQTDSLIGQTIGDFIVEEHLGAGGMATVYRAKQTSVNRDVALKVINLKQAGLQPDFQRRFAQEAEFIASLEHIHILPVYSYGIEGDVAYLAMRLLRGGSLRELLRNGEALPLERAVAIFRQVAKGLAYAHSKGIVHRDIKPANVLLDENGNAYLSDFGLAKSTTSGDLTQADVIVGTLTYMSPEQLKGERLDQRADVYSMGIMLYEMLTGKPPFSSELGEDLIGVMYKHLEAPPPSLKAANPLIPYEVEDVVLKALEKDRTARFFDMGEMVKALDHAIGISASSGFYPVAASAFRNAGSGSSTISTPHAAPPPSIRPRALWAVLAVALLALGLGGAAFLLNRPQPIPPHQVMPGETVAWDELLPSEAQIALAQQRLGAEGFIAIIACNQTSEYHTTITREISTRLRGYGLTTTTYDSASDGYEQRLRIEEALTAQAEAFIICPLDVEQIRAPLQAIEQDKLPLVGFTPFDQGYGGMYTAQEGSNYDMGEKVGRYAGQYISEQRGGQARVVILGFPDMQAIVERADGLRDGLLALAPQAEVVAEVVGGTREFGREAVAKLLEDGLAFDAILSINDAGSLGAVEALEAADIPADAVDIFSMDAEELALRYIREGQYMRGSLEVGRTYTAQAVSDATVRMLAGDTLAEIIQVPLGEVIDSASLLTP